MNVIGVCGWKNSGKTTLIEKVIPRLVKQGLSIAVVKHDAHGIEVDCPGKDSDRFYKAGADVILQGPGEGMNHFRLDQTVSLDDLLSPVLSRYDFIIVEGHKSSAIPKVWLNDESGKLPPDDLENVLEILPFDNNRADILEEMVLKLVNESFFQIPVYGCILIGGGSRRMGKSKHLLTTNNETWIERIVKQMEGVTKRIIVSGEGELPDRLEGMTRLPDVEDAKGPMSGLLSSMRWNSSVCWLVAACDMPMIRRSAFEWLLSKRRAGVWAVTPSLLGEKSDNQPLLAYYDLRWGAVLESAAASGDYSLTTLSTHPKAVNPAPPKELVSAWENINTVKELNLLKDSLNLDK